MSKGHLDGPARMLGQAIWFLVVVLVVILVAAVTCGAQDIGSYYVFPVVTRTAGAADTDWRTSVCLSNPSWYPLIINVECWQDGAMFGRPIEVNAYATRCTDDLFSEWFDAPHYQGTLILRALADENPVLDHVEFTASVKVYNDTRDGTFGVNVVGVPIFGPGDPRGPAFAWGQVSGVIQYGEPGESGFRAAFGMFNLEESEREVEIWLRAANGDVLWNRLMEIPGRSQRQIPVPRWLQIHQPGSIVVQDTEWREQPERLFGYATVVDNQTGDGVYMPMSTPYQWQFE